MAVSIDEKVAKLSTAQRKKVEARAAELAAEEKRRRAVRKAQRRGR